MKTYLVTDKLEQWMFAEVNVPVIDAHDYLLNSESYNEPSIRIINLCESYAYQTIGYYVSLLAAARGHKVVPSVLTIQDLTTLSLAASLSESLSLDIEHALKNLHSNQFELSVYFGRNLAKCYAQLSRKLNGVFPFPLFRVFFKKKVKWKIQKIIPLSIKDIPENHIDFLHQVANEFFVRKRFHTKKQKKYYYDLAILCNPQEITPPSDDKAIAKFIEVGDRMGINTQLIDKNDFKLLSQYDALFIRETTNVNHYTYNFSRRASADGLVVIDDPVSIFRCTNKVYLAELLKKNNIPIPDTLILSKSNWELLSKTLQYPCVLKKPDSYFSKGVVKIASQSALKKEIKKFFKESELIIAQSFIYSDYDWRIGILNHKVIFACRYYMAKGHWQIYNWDACDEKIGDYDSVPISGVPQAVLKAALRATKLIGNGLYGVDLKYVNHCCYVIEINDNPSIESEVEDALLGDELYHIVMSEFIERMKKNHGYK